MTDPVPLPVADHNRRPPIRRSLRAWFAMGFLIVFIGMLFLQMHFYDGRGVYQLRLWDYYLRAVRLEMKSTGAIGPTSGNFSAIVNTAFQHLATSVVAGGILAGVVWCARRRSVQ